MGPTSVRQPLLIYAIVFCVALAFTLVTFASLALIDVGRTAHIDAADVRVRQLASDGSLSDARRACWQLKLQSVEVAVVTSTTPALGIDVDTARGAVFDRSHGLQSGFVAAPIRGPGPEAYVVERFDTSRGLDDARAKIRGLIIQGAVAAIAFGLLLGIMLARLVLPQLSALKALAADTGADVWESTDAPPDEISEVAHAFRRTVRQLEADRTKIERQHDELERMQEGLVRASKLAGVGRLAAGIAHEIGNPLAAVRGYLSLMSRGLGEEEHADVLERSIKELNRIHETIQKLLAYARKDDFDEAPVELSSGAIVDDAIVLARGHPVLRDVEVRTAGFDATLDGHGQPGPLRQVLVNLLLNAGQAMEQTDDRSLAIVRRIDEDTIRIDVTDVGPGIPKSVVEQIFDPFFTTKPPGEGTGLGLAVSRAIMERMGGDLVAANAQGAGACFTVTIPRNAAGARPAKPDDEHI